MCLYIGITPEQLKAETDIICYKVLFSSKKATLFGQFFEQKGLYTPYQKFKVCIGRAYKSEFTYTMSGKGVEKAIHSFTTVESAKLDVHFFEGFSRYKGNMCICKCLIPKGSRYYQGTFDGRASYASNKIKYLEIIN